MQKLTRLSLIMVIIISALFFAACGNKEDDDNKNAPVLVTSITLAETNITLLKNDTYMITPIVLPENAANKAYDIFAQSTNQTAVGIDKATGTITALNAGTATLVVKAMDGSNKQAQLVIRVYNSPVQLATPTNFTLTGNKLTWSRVNQTLAYVVSIDGADQTPTSLTEYTITNFNALHSYQVRAQGDNHAILDSAYSAPILAKLLSTPTNFTHNNSTFSWDEVPGAARYDVYVNGAIINNGLNTTINLDLTAPQTYDVKVKAAIEEANAYSSNYTESIIVTRLASPTQVAQQNGGITWSPVPLANAYIVLVNDEEVETIFTSYELPMDADAIDYRFKVKAIGIDGNTLESVYSIEFITKKLETPQNLRIQDGKIMWDSVELAQSYSLELNGQLVQIGEDTEYAPLENYLAGVYSIRVIANGNNETFTSSNFSQVLNTNKLSKTQDVVVSNGIVVWQPVNLATKYTVLIGEESYVLYDTVFDASGLDIAGDHLLSVRAEAEGLISSPYSTPILVQKLSKPSNVRVENGLLRWDNVANASSYEVLAGSHLVEVKGSTHYLELPGGTSYDIKIRSLGGNRKYLNSGYTEILSVTKLQAPQNIRLENGYINFDLIENASSYVVKINDTPLIMMSDMFPYHINGAPGEVYNIQVLSRGDSEQYLNSDYSETVLQATQLGKVKNMLVENALITWDHVEGVQEYEVWIRPYDQEEYVRATDIKLTQTNSYELSNLVGGRYYIKVRALGNNFNALTGIDSEEIYVERLNTPQAFRIQDGMLRWNSVSNATKYLLKINGEVVENVKYDYYILDETYGLGTYTIQIAAYGDGKQFISSEWSEELVAERMAAPQNVRVVDGFIEWDIVEFANVYVVTINGGIHTGREDNWEDFETIFNPPYSYPSGRIEVIIYAANDTSLASVGTPVFVGNKMQAPTNVRIENKIIKWDSVLTTEEYRLFINDDMIDTQELSYDLTTYASYGPGIYNISVMALGDMGDGVGNRINSDYSNKINVMVLDAPSGLSVQDGRISFMPVSGAIDYEIRVYRKISENNYELLTIEEQILTGTGLEGYLLGSNYPAGDYAIDVRAIGNNINYITSAFSNQFFVTKLPAPSAFTLNNGLITYNSVLHAAGYEVYAKLLNQEEEQQAVYLNVNTQTTYEFELWEGNYNIAVRAVGDDTFYLTSDLTSEKNVDKLEEIKDFRVENGILKWSVNSGASQYILNINHQDYLVGLNSSYELPNNFVEGNYQIKIKARGNSVDKLNSSYTPVLNVYKMNAVTNLRLVDGLLTWDGVNAPNGYTIIVTNKTTLIETKITLQGNATSYALPSQFLADNYSIYVQTNGNSLTDLSSIKVGNYNNSAGFAVTKLETPANIWLTENLGVFSLNWTQVANASKYKLVIVKNNITIVDTFIPVGQGYEVEGLETGEHFVRVQAIGDNVDKVSSDLRAPITVTKPSTPTNLKIENGVVSWDASTYASEYKLSIIYEGEVQPVVTVTNTYYYLTDLGEYNISVRAYYSGSLPSEETETVTTIFNLFAGGNGSVETPFVIANATQFINMQYNPTAHYELVSDIMLSSANFTPIGTVLKPFIGSLNGNGHIVSGLTINQSYTYAGLFGYIGTTGTVTDITIFGTNITSASIYTGIVAGYNKGTINNVMVSGNVKPNLIDANNPLYAGGIAGHNDGIIVRVVATVVVEPSNLQNLVYAGGLVGKNNGEIIESGTNAGSSVKATYAGGIAGYNDGNIKQAYNKGNVLAQAKSGANSADGFAGGIAGYNLNTDSFGGYVGLIQNSYNHGNVSATSDNERSVYAGGIAGYNKHMSATYYGEIKWSYNAGSITASNSYASGLSFAGALTGRNEQANKLNNSYALTGTAAVLTTGTAGQTTMFKTDAEIKSSDFVNNFNYLNDPSANPAPNIWSSVDANTRAKLTWELNY